ncbi:hypothetical protein, partial [Serratia marcescens]|uniref:hypothetical protein n=1 Tax=Serratia marcescens TaxID=615 RepID=UPI0013C32E12
AEFSVYVKEPYVKVGESTILISKEDLLTGHYEDVSLDVIGSELPEKMKVELYSYKYGTKEVFTFKDKMDFIRSDKNQNASSYT